jgi:hypothetical protein
MDITCDYAKEFFPIALHMCKGLLLRCKARKLNQQWVFIVEVLYAFFFSCLLLV